MNKLRFARLVDAGILILVVVAARVALAQEPRTTEAPRRPEVGPRVAPPASGTPTAPPRLAPSVDSGPRTTPPMAPPTTHADGRVALQLKDGSRLVGKLVGLEKLKLKASFGEIEVPLDSILGFKLNEQPGRPSETSALAATILFKNGDVLTAEPILGNVKLETSWGDMSIAGKHVESLVTHTEQVAWQWDGKWRVVPAGTAGGWRPTPPGSPVSPYGPATFTPIGPGPFGAPAITFPSYDSGPPPAGVPMAFPAPPTLPAPTFEPMPSTRASVPSDP